MQVYKVLQKIFGLSEEAAKAAEQAIEMHYRDNRPDLSFLKKDLDALMLKFLKTKHNPVS